MGRYATRAALGLAMLTVPAAALAQSGWGQQPGWGSQPNGSVARGPAAMLVGVWNGVVNTPNGQMQITARYGPNGRFEAIVLMPVPGFDGGAYARFWGRYQARSNGGNQVTTQVHIAGQAPTEVCRAYNHMVSGNCQPVNLSPPTGGPATFLSADSLRTAEGITFYRSNGPGLLAHQVPARLVLNTVPNGGGGGGYGGGGYRPAPGTVTVQHPGNLQQERICAINDGTLVTYPDGREECKSPY